MPASAENVAGSLGQEPAGLVRRVAEILAGSPLEGTAEGSGELWFVISGTGVIRLESGHGASNKFRLRPDRGIWLPPGVRYQAAADAGVVRCDLVRLPAGGTAGPALPLTSDFADREIETTGDRQFRVIFGPATHFAAATQFVGEIPPGRAPEHSHPYDETVLVLGGEGIIHIGGASHPLMPGTCTHLRPGVPHCLENTGEEVLRVLGVFHPADSPAAKLPPTAGQPA